MTTQALDGVPMLIPARFTRARDALARVTFADLSAWIEALPTASRALADADTDTAKAWALDVIRALPTQGKGGGNDGNY